MTLKEEIHGLASIVDSLKQKYSLVIDFSYFYILFLFNASLFFFFFFTFFQAEETLLALNKLKDYLEREVQVKTNSVKIDEVLCLTLRSGVHYHAY